MPAELEPTHAEWWRAGSDRALDRAIAATADDDERAWAPQRAAGMLGAIVLVVIVFGSVVQALNLHDNWRASWAEVIGELLLAAPVVYFARPIARASGGWARALGFGPPRWSDLPLAVGWTAVQLLARGVVGAILVALLPAAKHERVSNVPTLAGKPLTVLVPLIFAIVVMAPIIEELAFRGVLLRSFMRRWGFQIGAVITGLLFGGLHFEQAGGPSASVILAATLALFGYLQAVLVRRTARLAPVMMVHAMNNALGVIFALHLHMR
jgi:membrane protease YdiL (CAAX protease family)